MGGLVLLGSVCHRMLIADANCEVQGFPSIDLCRRVARYSALAGGVVCLSDVRRRSDVSVTFVQRGDL